MSNHVNSESYIYLSHYFNELTPGYGGKKDFQSLRSKCISHGDTCNQLSLQMSNHVGTHIDFPYHFDENGKKLNDYSPNDLIFSKITFQEISLGSNELLTPEKIGLNISQDTQVLIIKTGFESKRLTDAYWNQNPGLSADLAPYLRETCPRIKVIGFDFISATSYTNKEEGKRAHLSFLSPQQGDPILIVEDMKLINLNMGIDIEWLQISPLLLDGADGAPVTVTAKTSKRGN